MAKFLNKLWPFKNACYIKVGWGLGNTLWEITVVFTLSSWNYVYYYFHHLFIANCFFLINSQSTLTVKSWWRRCWCMVSGVLGVDSQGIRKMAVEVVLMSILLTLGVFHTLLWCLCCWIWTGKCQLV